MRKMTEGSIVKHLLCYAVPLILGNLFQLTYNAVDSIIIGKFAGETAVAAVAAANPIMTIVILGVSGLNIGASVLMSQFYGASDMENYRKEVATTLCFGILCALAIAFFGILAANPILRLIRVPEEAIAMSSVYLRIIMVGFLFTFIYNVYAASLKSVGETAIPVFFLAISSVLNGCLDFIFIGVFSMSSAGAGLATLIAEAVSAGLCILYVRKKVPVLRFQKSELKIDPDLLKKTLSSGSVTALQQSCQPIGKVLIQACINAQGVSVIAAFNAVCRVDDFACIPEQSISHGMMTAIAQNRGAGKMDRVREIFKKGLMLEVCYWVLICIVVQLLKRPIMYLFAPDKGSEMIEIGVGYLTIMAFFYILPGFTNGMQGFFRGIGKMKITLIGTLIQISIRVMVVYGLVPRVGLTGAAFACACGWSMMIVFETIVYLKIRKNLAWLGKIEK